MNQNDNNIVQAISSVIQTFIMVGNFTLRLAGELFDLNLSWWYYCRPFVCIYSYL